MASLPSSTVSVSASAGALAGGTGYCVVFGCVATAADTTPRVYASWKGIYDQHGYSQALDYSALHIEKTQKPVIFVGIPVVTAGTIRQNNASGVTGGSVITVTGTPLEEVDAIVSVTTGGTIGTSGIVLSISMDGGRTYKAVKLGTATTYTVPYLGITLNFAAGTLVADDEYTFTTTAPMWDAAGVNGVQAALAAQQKAARSWMAIGDVTTATVAGYIVTAINNYRTANKRFSLARASVADRLPLPRKSQVAGQTLTFATPANTITRSAGSWIEDGFAVGDTVTIDGSTDNDGDHVITTLTATVLTAAGSTIVAEVATPSEDVSATAAQGMSAWVAAADAAFETIDAQPRIDLSLGRMRVMSPITGWFFRRPVSWAASIREYQKDIHVTNWRVKDGPLDGWSMTDDDGNIVEFDQRVDGGGLEGRFTCATTLDNGPNGAFIATSLTRDVEGSLLSYTHNMYVANVACTVVQAATTMFLGQTVPLKADGTMRAEARSRLESAVNTDLEIALMKELVPGEGSRCSSVRWIASADDDLSVVGATITGVCELVVNGTIVNVNTVVRVS